MSGGVYLNDLRGIDCKEFNWTLKKIMMLELFFLLGPVT